MADHRNDGLSASGSAQARSESGDVATSLSAVSEQVQEVSSVVLVAEGVGAMSGRATDIYGTPSGTSSEGEEVPDEEPVTEGQFEDEEDDNGDASGAAYMYEKNATATEVGKEHSVINSSF